MLTASALCLGLAATASALVARNNVEGCLISSGVPIDQRGTVEYKNDTTPFNLRLPYAPAAVAVPKSTDHIQKAVWCAKKSGVKASAKSGGHSYASFGFGGEDGHLIIELNRMDGVSLAPGNIAVVQPGARLGHLATVLNNKYGRAIAHGTCPGVGISGHFLHGGFGFSSHMHGLALDFVDSATVVLADGTIAEASATKNSDLLWALKGAGSNFGIVAEWRLKTIDAPKTLTRFVIPLGWTTKAHAVQGITAYEKYASTVAPREINFRFGDYGRGKPQIEGIYYGTIPQWKAAIAPLLAALPKTYNDTAAAKELSWIDSVISYSNFDDIDMFYPIQQPNENFYSKSLMVKTLAGKATQNFVDYYFDVAINDNATNTNDRFWFFQLDMHGGANSQVAKVANSATAYAHRDKLFLIQFYDRYPNDFTYPPSSLPFLKKWVDGVTSALKPDQWGAYINYADPLLGKDEAQRLYYADNLPRLKQLKAKFDKDQLFYYPQAITPAPAGPGGPY